MLALELQEPCVTHVYPDVYSGVCVFCIIHGFVKRERAPPLTNYVIMYGRRVCVRLRISVCWFVPNKLCC